VTDKKKGEASYLRRKGKKTRCSEGGGKKKGAISQVGNEKRKGRGLSDEKKKGGKGEKMRDNPAGRKGRKSKPNENGRRRIFVQKEGNLWVEKKK